MCIGRCGSIALSWSAVAMGRSQLVRCCWVNQRFVVVWMARVRLIRVDRCRDRWLCGRYFRCMLVDIGLSLCFIEDIRKNETCEERRLFLSNERVPPKRLIMPRMVQPYPHLYFIHLKSSFSLYLCRPIDPSPYAINMKPCALQRSEPNVQAHIVTGYCYICMYVHVLCICTFQHFEAKPGLICNKQLDILTHTIISNIVLYGNKIDIQHQIARPVRLISKKVSLTQTDNDRSKLYHLPQKKSNSLRLFLRFCGSNIYLTQFITIHEGEVVRIRCRVGDWPLIGRGTRGNVSLVQILRSRRWIMEILYGWIEIRSGWHTNSGGNFCLVVWHGRAECHGRCGKIGRGGRIKRVLGISSLGNGRVLSTEKLAV